MITEPPAGNRDLASQRIDADLAIIGGGMAGTCAAITAARAGMKVALIQDRPVLGGNASSEVRMWMVGATAHMGNNNRWAREGGVIDEIVVENCYRNPEGNPVLFDALLLEFVAKETNITLLLNTACIDVMKQDADTIAGVRAYCAQNETWYEVYAPLFCDASGDGVVGFLAGAAFRMGAESTDEFGEKFAPSQEYGELLGHTIYFYSKDMGRPVKFIPPSYALGDITQIPRYRSFNTKEYGNKLWWIEYGGRLDTIHDSEKIKWELWRIVYGVWHYIKNSGEFPEAETLTLEWVGLVPGKRESRRFEGPYMLTQQDIIEQRHHGDAVACGGWAIDLHPADGIYSEKPGCDQWHARGVYQVPYRCLYSRNIKNLFVAGRIMSTSHVAFGSIRVMHTLAHAAQAVGMAAALCKRGGLLPADLSAPHQIKVLQCELLRRGQFIPDTGLDDPDDLARHATISATSQLRLAALPPDGPTLRLDRPQAQMLPVGSGLAPRVSFCVDVAEPTVLRMELRTSQRPGNFTPDTTLDVKEVALRAGKNQRVVADFGVTLNSPCYLFYCLMPNNHVSVRCSEQRVTGLLRVSYRSTQMPTQDIGVETFEFWAPERRPGGHNFAITVEPPLEVFGPENAVNGFARPTTGPNAWVADFNDPAPALTLRWPRLQKITRIELTFDTDRDHPLEHLLMGHPERAMPFCVRHYRLTGEKGRVLAECADNHQTLNSVTFAEALVTNQLTIELLESHGPTPKALYQVCCR